MARELKWAESAWNDLEEISEYIAKDSKYYAASFVHEVRESTQNLNQFAEMGRKVPEFDDIEIREIFIKSFRLIYKIEKNTIFIIGIIHGARDLLTLWDKEKKIP
jgi:addiction module RelE/StbE family toxin